jgi:hypothetical protein
MTNTQPQELHEDAAQDSTWSNAPTLSRKVRELAHRSYLALKAGTPPNSLTKAGSEDIVDDLRDLRDQVARLQQKIHARRLGALIPWVDALSQQVEDRLGDAEKAEERCDSAPVKSSE